MGVMKNEIHPINSLTSLESHLKRDIFIQIEDIRGVDNLYAFFLAFLAFFCLLTIDGTSYTTGLLTEHIQDRFNITYLPKVLLPGSLVIGIYHVTGPLIGALNSGKNRFRTRAILGALLACIASLISVFIKNYYAFTFTFGILMGVGMGLIFIPCIVNVNSWFVKQKPFGLGFAHTGSGFGIFIFSQFLPNLPKGFEIEGHLIGISVLFFICIGCAYFFVKPEKYIEETLKQKKLESRKEMINKLNFEEKLRLENSIFKCSILNKKHDETTSNCELDGMVLTMDNDLIHVTGSTAALYDQPRLTKEQVEHITELVLQKFKIQEENPSDLDHDGLKEMVLEFIQSTISINNLSIVNSQENLSVKDENICPVNNELKELIVCSIRMELDKICNNKITERVLEDEIIKESSLSDLAFNSVYTISNTENEKSKNESQKRINHFSRSIWRSPTFLLIIFSSMIAGLELITPYSFVPLFLRSNGVNETDSATVISLMGLSNIVGRVLSEVYVEKVSGRISYDDSLWFHNGGLLVAAISIICVPYLLDYFQMFTIFCCLHTVAMVFSNSIKISLILDYIGLDALTKSYTSIIMIQGVFMIAGPPLHGLLFEFTSRNFHIIFLAVGGLLCISAFVSCFIKLTNYLEHCAVIDVYDAESCKEQEKY